MYIITNSSLCCFVIPVVSAINVIIATVLNWLAVGLIVFRLEVARHVKHMKVTNTCRLLLLVNHLAEMNSFTSVYRACTIPPEFVYWFGVS